MSGDEVFALLVGSLVALVAWGWRWIRLGQLVTWRADRGRRLWFAASPLLIGVILFLVLRHWAAQDVRDSSVYLPYYLVLGLGWVGAGLSWCRWQGVDGPGDGIGRGNPATLPAETGAILGLTACYAGANLGDGPGWWCVVFAGGLATGTWAIAWRVLDAVTAIGEAVQVERDPAAGWRLGGYLVASGILCGRGGAGDWHGFDQTVREFSAA